MTPRSLEVRLLLALGATACSIGQSDSQPQSAPGFEVPQAEGPRYDGMDVLVSEGPFVFGDVTVHVISAPPNAEVVVIAGTGAGSTPVMGLASDLMDPKVVALGTTNAQGRVTLRGPHQTFAAVGLDVGLQVLSREGAWRSEIVRKTVEPFALTCGPATFNSFEQDVPMVFCDTQTVATQCEPAEAVNPPLAAIASVVGVGTNNVTAQTVCHEPAGTSACCYQFSVQVQSDSGWGTVDSGGGGWGAGRPFRVHGTARHSPVIAVAGIEEMACPESIRPILVEAWTNAARAEHASVAAFARFTLELMQLGAPLDLLRDATRAQADEIHHARLTLEMASKLGGEDLQLGGLAMEGALEGRDLRTIVMDVVREGCISETVSALFAMEARDRATHPRIREIQAVLAEDESRHSELAWRFVRWALEQAPALRPEVMGILADFSPEVTAQPDPQGAMLGAFGVLDEHTSQTVARRAARVIERCASSLS